MAVRNRDAYKPPDRPMGAYCFSVEIGSNKEPAGRFQSVSGLSHEFEVVTHQEGGLNQHTHKLPGQGSYPNLVLKQGYITQPWLEDWHRNFLTRRDRQTVTVKLLHVNDHASSDLQPVRTWVFSRCWPVKWEGPTLDSSQPAIAVQTIELAHDGPPTGRTG